MKNILYGYIDYWDRDRIIDLKTTGSYEWGKFERKWQRHVYPYCAIESGATETVNEFVYLVALLKTTRKSPWVSGTLYPEVYTYNHEQTTRMLRPMVELFISWLEAHRDKITDKKIFNEIED